MDFIIDYLPLFMFAALGVLLFSGYPVGAVLGGIGLGLVMAFPEIAMWLSRQPLDQRRGGCAALSCRDRRHRPPSCSQ